MRAKSYYKMNYNEKESDKYLTIQVKYKMPTNLSFVC